MSKTKPEKYGLWSKERVTMLVETHRFPLLYFAAGILGNLADAEDVVEDALARLLIKKPRLTDETAVKTYLFSTVKHLAVDYLRKKRRRQKQQAELMYLSKQDVECIEHNLCRTERKRALMAALNELTSGAREVLYLQYFENLPPRKIAKITGKSVKQIYNLTARAKKSVAKKLREEEEAYENEP